MTNVSCDYYIDLLEKTVGAWQDNNEAQEGEVRQDLINHLLDKCGLVESDIAHLR